MSLKEMTLAKAFYENAPSHFTDRVDGACSLPWQLAQEENTPEWQAAVKRAKARRSHYEFLKDHYATILTRMGHSDRAKYVGSFVSSGDKYYQYRDRWEQAGVPFFHGAAMYHLIEDLFHNEVRETETGWVDPWKWVVNNYKSGHNLSQYMEGLE